MKLKNSQLKNIIGNTCLYLAAFILASCNNSSHAERVIVFSGDTVGYSIKIEKNIEKEIFKSNYIIDSIINEVKGKYSFKRYIYMGKNVFLEEEYKGESGSNYYSFSDLNDDNSYFKIQYSKRGDILEQNGCFMCNFFVNNIDRNTLEVKKDSIISIYVLLPKIKNTDVNVYVIDNSNLQMEYFENRHENLYYLYLQTINLDTGWYSVDFGVDIEYLNERKFKTLKVDPLIFKVIN